MSVLLEKPAYGQRDEQAFLGELDDLTRHHMAACAPYGAIVGPHNAATRVEEVPYLHVGLFKHLQLSASVEGVKKGRVLQSSATSGVSSAIHLDSKSSDLQQRSSQKILSNCLGDGKRPLIVVDSSKSLLRRGTISARVAAAMSLRFLASEVVFILDDADDPASVRWDELARVLADNEEVVIYGFSWILWLAFARLQVPEAMCEALSRTRARFVHSGGWKKLAAQQVDRDTFDAALIAPWASTSDVLDYYGLVEQVGIVYPLCKEGFRHVPVWADVVVRDSFSRESLVGSPGQLQLLNVLAWGAPYHSVLTEDVGTIVPGVCGCGRSGKRFELHGRLAKAEVRGCANV